MNNINLNWAYEISNTLYSMGVRHVCICPGARNSALTIAFTSNNKFNATSHIDERSAGYFALGLSKKTRVPTIIITTSGTAIANLFPSLIEANYSKIPLIALTADRPANLIGLGENQTIIQNNIYGEHVRDSFEIGLPAIDYSTLTNTLITAYNNSMGSYDIPPGPVHINAPFDEPIVDCINPKNNENNILTYKRKKINYKIDYNDIDFTNSIIVCGEIHPDDSLDSILEFSEYINAPIFADPTSNIRYYKEHRNIISNYNYIINNIPSPNYIIRFGRKPTSKIVNNYIKNHGKVILIDRYPLFNDSSNHTIKSDYVSFVDYIKSNSSKNNKKSRFENILKQQKNISSIIENYSNEDSNCEGLFINELLMKIDSHSNIFIGNSMAIREADDLTQNIPKKHKVYSNRGASGIDGLVSTAIGLGYNSPDNLNICIIGDLSLYHDMNGLHFLKKNNINTKFIIINNNGGGIFSTLPINQLNYSRFNEFWTTPLDIDIKNIAKVYDIEYLRAKNSSEALLAINKNSNPMIIDYKVDVNQTRKVKSELISIISK